MFEAFRTVANVAIPLATAGSRVEPVAAEMHAWNALAEEWLSSVSSLYFWIGSASQAGGLSDRGQQAFLAAMSDQERARLALNQATRLANSQLVSACELLPIELYSESGS